jgi:lipopolysaccharide/colanic/teichoic acid biosynthesis glycosyltransferase
MSTMYNQKLKRFFDILFTIPLIVLFAPLMALIWIGIRLTSVGPAFYIQPRVGKNGRTFHLLKFRTMYTGHSVPEPDLEALALGKTGVLLKVKNDPRVTPLGHIIRRASIDELPQLFNVLAGDMSLVGPRPVVHLMASPYDPTKNPRFSVLPGITGYWQVYAREKGNELTDMLGYDLLYIKEISFWNDLKVLALTIPAVLSGRGAF